MNEERSASFPALRWSNVRRIDHLIDRFLIDGKLGPDCRRRANAINSDLGSTGKMSSSGCASLK